MFGCFSDAAPPVPGCACLHVTVHVVHVDWYYQRENTKACIRTGVTEDSGPVRWISKCTSFRSRHASRHVFTLRQLKSCTRVHWIKWQSGAPCPTDSNGMTWAAPTGSGWNRCSPPQRNAAHASHPPTRTGSTSSLTRKCPGCGTPPGRRRGTTQLRRVLCGVSGEPRTRDAAVSRGRPPQGLAQPTRVWKSWCSESVPGRPPRAAAQATQLQFVPVQQQQQTLGPTPTLLAAMAYYRNDNCGNGTPHQPSPMGNLPQAHTPLAAAAASSPVPVQQQQTLGSTPLMRAAVSHFRNATDGNTPPHQPSPMGIG